MTRRAADLVLQARLNGMSVDMVYLGFLAGAARRLGERWDEDRTTSAQMTIAAGRIYAIMRGLRQAFTSDHYLTPPQEHALFVSTPGETHTLGVTMAADFFRRRGWQIDLRTGLGHHELLDRGGPSHLSRHRHFGIQRAQRFPARPPDRGAANPPSRLVDHGQRQDPRSDPRDHDAGRCRRHGRRCRRCAGPDARPYRADQGTRAEPRM